MHTNPVMAFVTSIVYRAIFALPAVIAFAYTINAFAILRTTIRAHVLTIFTVETIIALTASTRKFSMTITIRTYIFTKLAAIPWYAITN
jgi:hypothetical protein